MLVDWNKIVTDYKLFWQFPVITEETVYSQEKKNPNYIGFPWATVIDKHYNLKVIYNIIKPKLEKDIDYITCCQHIHFHRLLPLFGALGVKTLYTPHKVLGADFASGIRLKAAPLYAVNIEDKERNKVFIGKDFMNVERKYLYSFMGGYQRGYLTDIRKKIFLMDHSANTFIKNTGDWHFNPIVYGVQQNPNGTTVSKSHKDIEKDHNEKTDTYNHLLLNSRFSLCPSGSGPNSIRFWESLAVGAIPILLADTLELPPHELWEDTIIQVPESDVEKLPEMLKDISIEKEEKMRTNCLKMYAFFRNNFLNLI